MLQVHIYIDAQPLTVDLVGHAGYSDAGKDIVCAGISTLVEAFILAMRAVEACNGCEPMTVVDYDDSIRLSIPAFSGDRPRPTEEIVRYAIFDGAFGVLLCGLRALADTYPQYVSVDSEVGQPPVRAARGLTRYDLS